MQLVPLHHGGIHPHGAGGGAAAARQSGRVGTSHSRYLAKKTRCLHLRGGLALFTHVILQSKRQLMPPRTPPHNNLLPRIEQPYNLVGAANANSADEKQKTTTKTTPPGGCGEGMNGAAGYGDESGSGSDAWNHWGDESGSGSGSVVGMYTLNAVAPLPCLTPALRSVASGQACIHTRRHRSLTAPGFNPRTYEVRKTSFKVGLSQIQLAPLQRGYRRRVVVQDGGQHGWVRAAGVGGRGGRRRGCACFPSPRSRCGCWRRWRRRRRQSRAQRWGCTTCESSWTLSLKAPGFNPSSNLATIK
jgi:hypothetical protein